MFKPGCVIGSNSKRSANQTPAAVLIVDDETELAITWARVLKASGFECLVAHDGPSALFLFDSKQPAIVLSDINLPVGDGFEISRHVRLKSPATPVILVTAHHTPTTPQEAFRNGAARYLCKPFSNADLIATIKSLLQTGRSSNPDLA